MTQAGSRADPLEAVSHLVAAAGMQAGDDELDELHRALATTIVDGAMIATVRPARMIARRELKALGRALTEALA